MKEQAAWHLVRPGNVGLAALGVLVGGLAAAGLDAHWASVAFAMGVAALGVAGANVLNDALDARLDRTAHPRRAVASGRVTVQAAARWAVAFLVGALLVALAVNVWVVLLAALLAALVIAYEFRFKESGLAGNFLVSYNAGSLLVLGGLAALAPPLTYAPERAGAVLEDVRLLDVLVMAGLAAWLNFAREVYKDIEDASHDAGSRRTFPVVHGERAARRLAAGAAWTLIPAALAPWALGLFDGVYLFALLPLLFLLAAVPFAGGADASQRLLKFGILLGFLPFLARALL